jgi:hypothetical protein
VVLSKYLKIPLKNNEVQANIFPGSLAVFQSEWAASVGEIPPEPPFRPPRLEAEAKRTISSFSLTAILKINPDISKSKSFFFTLSKPIRNINTYCHHLDNNYWDNN